MLFLKSYKPVIFPIIIGIPIFDIQGWLNGPL